MGHKWEYRCISIYVWCVGVEVVLVGWGVSEDICTSISMCTGVCVSGDMDVWSISRVV